MFLPEIDGFYTRDRLSERKVIVRLLYCERKERIHCKKKEREEEIKN